VKNVKVKFQLNDGNEYEIKLMQPFLFYDKTLMNFLECVKEIENISLSYLGMGEYPSLIRKINKCLNR
ncbi:hypothetical protein II906_03335, partial [bacterium]|nr:hypothetical protein [bacterium]